MAHGNGTLAAVDVNDRPLIGVTLPDCNARVSWLALRLAIWRAGGRAIALRPRTTLYTEPVDGLILSGGEDIDPRLYGRPRKPHYTYSPARDRMEQRWLQRALYLGVPVLGICRGAQLINISRGGTLVPDLRKLFEAAHYPTDTLGQILYRKRILVARRSSLERLFRARAPRVNSLHTQAVDQLGDGLEVIARDQNDVPQAIEDPRFPMLLGVQFHPEYLQYQRAHQAIFRELIRQARQPCREAGLPRVGHGHIGG